MNEQLAPLWSVIAPLAALAGVSVTLVVQGRRLDKQFKHERDLKDVDREFALRKEVYLAAAEALSVGTRCLGKSTDLSVEDSSLFDDYFEKSGAVAKAYVIATQETWRAMNNFSVALLAAQAEVVALRAPLRTLLARKASHQKIIDAAFAERGRMLGLMKELNLNHEVNNARFDAIKRNFDHEGEVINKQGAMIDDLDEELRPKHIGLARKVLDHLTSLAGLSIEVLAQVRSELDLPIDMQQFKEMNEQVFAQARLSIENFMR